jgi:putative FmdB family regulatory protein
MPIYEYECSNCRYYLEVMQKISDAKLKKCPSCRKNALKKLISAPVFRLKGSGWYETDFKGDQEKRRNLAGGEKEPAGEAKDGKDAKAAGAADDGGADAKVDTKTESKGDGDKTVTKSESKPEKPEAARGKERKSQSARPAAKAKPAPRRAPAKAASKPAKRRGRR